MIFGSKMLILTTGCLVLSLTARGDVGQIATGAASDENPYRDIAVRNVFALHDAADDHRVVPPESPKLDVKLTGITSVLGKKQALLIVNTAEVAGKAKTSHSLILSEGQRAGEIEVLEINLRARTVKIRNDKQESPIDLCLAKTGK